MSFTRDTPLHSEGQMILIAFGQSPCVIVRLCYPKLTREVHTTVVSFAVFSPA